MEKKITISNTTGQFYRLAYRMPGEEKQILYVEIIAAAMFNEISFPNENYYNEFKKQNLHYFTGNNPVLIEGKVSGNKLEKINEAIESEFREKIESEIKTKIDDKIEAISSEHAAPIGIQVQKNQKELPIQRSSKTGLFSATASKGKGKGKK